MKNPGSAATGSGVNIEQKARNFLHEDFPEERRCRSTGGKLAGIVTVYLGAGLPDQDAAAGKLMTAPSPLGAMGSHAL